MIRKNQTRYRLNDRNNSVINIIDIIYCRHITEQYNRYILAVETNQQDKKFQYDTIELLLSDYHFIINRLPKKMPVNNSVYIQKEAEKLQIKSLEEAQEAARYTMSAKQQGRLHSITPGAPRTIQFAGKSYEVY